MITLAGTGRSTEEFSVFLFLSTAKQYNRQTAHEAQCHANTALTLPHSDQDGSNSWCLRLGLSAVYLKNNILYVIITLFVIKHLLLRWQMDCTFCTHKLTRSTGASVQRLFASQLLAHGSWQALALPCWQSLAAAILQKLPSTMMTAATP